MHLLHNAFTIYIYILLHSSNIVYHIIIIIIGDFIANDFFLAVEISSLADKNNILLRIKFEKTVRVKLLIVSS